MPKIPNPLDLIPGSSGILSVAYDQLTGWVKRYIGSPFVAVYTVLIDSTNSVVAVVKLMGDVVGVLEGEWRQFLKWGPFIVFRWLLVLLKFQTRLFGDELAAVLLAILGGVIQVPKYTFGPRNPFNKLSRSETWREAEARNERNN